jgi:hypothetical protein
MRKPQDIFVAIVVIGAFLIGAYFLLTNASSDEDKNTDDTEETNSKSSNEDEVAEGPVPFSEVNKGIMDAADDYEYFSFVNMQGTCLDQGFPANLIYDSANVVKTEDGSYVENLTAVDFLGQISFDELPLSTGSASCIIGTSAGVDNANVKCSVNGAEVCAATFEVLAH